MQVIPAINEIDFTEIKKKIQIAESFGAEWVHIDVADGQFTKNFLWNDPRQLKSEFVNFKVKIEVHLMIQNPDAMIGEWLEAGAKRVVVHVEAVKNVDALEEMCKQSGAELVLAVNPETPVEQLLQYPYLDNFLILAVVPGTAGQKFQELQLERISALRAKLPDAKIEVDGGVNLENAPKIKTAGADILVSASSIWNSENPKEAYKKLIEL
jgi:ribulose-phosphate 3-epimerase